ncbi:MAG: hypothetical protein AAGF66_03245 [Cyanobacteria bacterium P01_H01_bin.119]
MASFYHIQIVFISAEIFIISGIARFIEGALIGVKLSVLIAGLALLLAATIGPTLLALTIATGSIFCQDKW